MGPCLSRKQAVPNIKRKIAREAFWRKIECEEKMLLEHFRMLIDGCYLEFKQPIGHNISPSGSMMLLMDCCDEKIIEFCPKKYPDIRPDLALEKKTGRIIDTDRQRYDFKKHKRNRCFMVNHKCKYPEWFGKFQSTVTIEEECSICFGMTDTESLGRLPCNHLFHNECLDEWFKKDGTCPMCRAPKKF